MDPVFLQMKQAGCSRAHARIRDRVAIASYLGTGVPDNIYRLGRAWAQGHGHDSI
jgi:hypothetical protein